MRKDELLEELGQLLLLISEDEVEKDVVEGDTLEELREGLSSLILRLKKEGVN